MTTDRLKFLWITAFHDGYFNNNDIKELLDINAINKFYDVFNVDFLKNVKSINCSEKLKIKLIEICKQFSKINEKSLRIEETSNKLGSFLISEDDSDYPYYWRMLSGMPRLVFGLGKRELINTNIAGGAAIVGSRRCSNYSKVATVEISGHLVNKGITIISGMADGIDRVAHETALKQGGKTIAFLAGGVDNIYPWINKDIYEGIVQNGLILSEMPPGTKALKQYFPSRNRLISGLSDVCLIMEAGCHSGTLHTASFAAAQGKPVFVLPNTIYNNEAIGGLELIADGARILIRAEDVVNEVAECCFYKLLNMGKTDLLRKNDAENDPNINKLINELSVKARTADELVQLTAISYTELSVLLSEMEIRGSIIVERGKYVLTR